MVQKYMADANNTKNKNGLKVSVIVDTKGIPNTISLAGANNYDSLIADKQLVYESPFVDLESKKVYNSNKYKQVFLGDAAYFSKNIYSILKKRKIIPITDVNIRNTKDGKKIYKLNKIKNKYIKNQHKRIIVENSFAWLKIFPKANLIIEKSIQSFIGMLLLYYCKIANNKLK